MAATLVAFCRALLVTFAGSRIPACTIFYILLVQSIEAYIRTSDSLTLLMITAPSRPAFAAMWYRGASSAFSTMLGTGLLITCPGLQPAPSTSLGSMDVSRTTATDDTFLYSCSGCRQCIFHTKLCFLHLGLGCCADTDYCYAAGQLCQTLLIASLDRNSEVVSCASEP